MSNEKKRIERANTDTIKCDNEACDFVKEIKEASWAEWLNAPCPKCGANLLTQEDLDRASLVQGAVNFINGLTDEQHEAFSKILGTDKVENPLIKAGFNPDEKVTMSVNTHKDISFVIKKLDDHE